MLSYVRFLDSTPGSAELSGSVGGGGEVTVHLVSPSIVPPGTPCDSFLMNGSFEEKAREAHATSSPELTPTGVPYPSIEGHTLTPVDSDGFPCRDAGSPSLRASQGRAVRPLSTLSDAGLRLQSISAWYLFKEGSPQSSVREERLSTAVEGYNKQFQAVSDALDYEPAGPGDDSEISEISPQKLTVQGILSPVTVCLLFPSFVLFLGSDVITLDDTLDSASSSNDMDLDVAETPTGVYFASCIGLFLVLPPSPPLFFTIFPPPFSFIPLFICVVFV